MSSIHTDGAQWLRSPLQEKKLRLQPRRELVLRPYFGTRRRVQLFRTLVVLGQAPDCDIRIEDPFVSPRHAEFRLSPGGDGYTVHDLSSRNGVFVNGVRVGVAPLPSQGTLRLGRSTISWVDPVPDAELGAEGCIVADPSMRAVLQSLRRVALSQLPVLLLGETGTGKDVLARLLHLWGPAMNGPYVPVNGGLTGGELADSELFGHHKGAFTGAESRRLGAIRSAQGGTLFLDEVADIPLATQVKLLRALENGEVKALGADNAERTNFRLVCATSRNVEKQIHDGGFRLDLYYRIAGFVIHVPPLRERPLDILAIARSLSAERGLSLDAEAEARLLSYRWPGNVRELRSAIERAAVIARGDGAERILREHIQGIDLTLSEPHSRENEKPLTLNEQERRFVLSALERNGWSRVAAARELGIARSSLLGKMRRFGLRDEMLLTNQLTARSDSG
ncbi:MAG: sigma 54-interacting transcriptional regulator [Bdellovibrionota bacterium]